MAHGVNANLARRWISEAEGPTRKVIELERAEAGVAAPKSALPPPFVPVTMPSTSALSEIRVELRSGSTATVMSLAQSARMQGHDPWAYFKDVLTRLPTHPNRRIDELLPHRWVSAA